MHALLLTAVALQLYSLAVTVCPLLLSLHPNKSSTVALHALLGGRVLATMQETISFHLWSGSSYCYHPHHSITSTVQHLLTIFTLLCISEAKKIVSDSCTLPGMCSAVFFPLKTDSK